MKKIMFIILTVIVVIVIGYLYLPLKFAISPKKAMEMEKYIIVQVQYSTAALWRIVGDENGMYSKPIDATLYGNLPDLNYSLQTGDNKFICVAEYQETKMMESGYENAIYNVTSWEILYPIKRNGIFPRPKAYLSAEDFVQ